jgi:cytoplasmic iron level regulating protein YaaA (DUF328/UPF0246 family)
LERSSIIIISSCSASKDDSVRIPSGSKIVTPSYYISNEELRAKLINIRKDVFSDPKAQVGKNTTYAFDLYVRAGNAYKDIFKCNYNSLRDALIRSNAIKWFFLSGGYGIIHALEKAHKYQATFNYNIAQQRGILYTAKLWNTILSKICDAIFSAFKPSMVYVFGSKDYTHFVKETEYWMINRRIKIFESTGSSGARWVSPILNELVNAIIKDKIQIFNAKYNQKFIKERR